METPRPVSGALDVRLQVGEGRVKLLQLKELTERLQRTLAALANQLADSTSSGIDFEIAEASIGSLSFGLRAIAEHGSAVDPDRVLSTFTADLAHIREQSYRPDLTPGLTKHYRGLVTCLGGVGAVVEYTHGSDHIVVDDAFRRGFEVALKERVAEDISIVGYLDAINAHKAPFTFSMYPKLEDADRIECRFPSEMLEEIAKLLKKTVKAEGRGHFAPVGIYPLRVEVYRVPRVLAWDPATLRSYVGRLALVPQGMSAREYVEENRKVAGLAD